MTPKEKAKELVDKYTTVLSIPLSKEFALIAVDELIKQENKYNNGSFYPLKYWQEVEKEIMYL